MSTALKLGDAKADLVSATDDVGSDFAAIQPQCDFAVHLQLTQPQLGLLATANSVPQNIKAQKATIIDFINYLPINLNFWIFLDLFTKPLNAL